MKTLDSLCYQTTVCSQAVLMVRPYIQEWDQDEVAHRDTVSGITRGFKF